MANPQPEPSRWPLDFGKSARARRLRREVFLRDDFTCQICGYRPATVPGDEYDGRYTIGDFGHRAMTLQDLEQQHLQLDHIKPRCRGGALLDPANLQTLCNYCNVRKGGADG